MEIGNMVISELNLSIMLILFSVVSFLLGYVLGSKLSKKVYYTVNTAEQTIDMSDGKDPIEIIDNTIEDEDEDVIDNTTEEDSIDTAENTIKYMETSNRRCSGRDEKDDNDVLSMRCWR